MTYKYDLHIHSCLSPCADNEMTPSTILGMAKLEGLDIVAICDHNSCKNLPAAEALAKEYEISLVYGMELTTSEEIHVLCLFDNLDKAMRFDAYVEERLFKIENKSSVFGDQLIMDEHDHIIGNYPYILSNATEITIDEVSTIVKDFEGLAIPAHIEREATSICSVLGFVSEDLGFTSVEIKHLDKKSNILGFSDDIYNVISNSDAHMVEELLRQPMEIELPECSAKALLDKLSLPPI